MCASSSVSVDFAAAIGELDQAVQIRDLAAAEASLWSAVVSVPLFQTGFALAHAAKVDNVVESPTDAGVMWDAEDWVIVAGTVATTSTSVSGRAGSG